ncbi:MAG: cytochrome c biogenesis CcdA family protein [Thermoplasmatota archaeon]
MTDAVTPAIAFAAGLVSFISPCVVPVVPGYLAFVTGGVDSSRGKRMVLTSAFVAGFGIAFVALGVAVGALEGTAALHTTDLWVRRIGGVLIITFGLAMTGLLRLPFMDRDLRYHGDAPKRAGPFFGALGLGAAFGVGWSPCVGPILGSILILGGSGGAQQGAFLLGVYALGLAIPFLVVGYFAERANGVLRRFSRAARVVEIVGGILLIALGIAVFTGALARLLTYVV